MKNREFPSALWVLDKPDNFENEGKQGNLSFTGKEFKLSIPFGSLIDRPSDNGVTIFNTDPIERSVAFGYCQTGEKITLIDLSTFGPVYSTSGFERENLWAKSALSCKSHFISPNPNIRDLTLHISSLWNWVGQYFGDVVHHIDDTKWVKTTGSWSYKDLDELPLFENDVMKISLQPVLKYGGGSFPVQEFSMKSDVLLIFNINNRAMSLDNVMVEWVYPIWKLLTFCMGFRCSIDEIELHTEDNHKAQYYLPLIHGEENPSETLLRRMPLPYDFINNHDVNFFEKWLALNDDAKRAAATLINLYDGGIYSLDPMFITITSAFEAISRVGEKTHDIETARLRGIKKQIKECFNNSKDANWIINKLNNIPPASNYANSLVKKLDVFSDYVIPNREQFLKDLRKNRNAYIHQTSAIDSSAIFSDAKLYTLTMTVKVLCYGAVMLELGMTPEVILGQFKATGFCRTEIHQSRDMYSK